MTEGRSINCWKCSSASSSFSLCVAPYDTIAWQKIVGNNAVNNGDSVPYVYAEDLSDERFFDDFLQKNIPCVFSPSLTTSWLSRRLWCHEGTDELNYEYLLHVYGNALVSAVNCDDPEYKEGYGTRDCRDMTFRDYIESFFVKSTTPGKSLVVGTGVETTDKIISSCLYLKDWHIIRFHKECSNHDEKQEHDIFPYECPIYFQSDWLNEFCDDMNLDDYKFCYVGPKGSFTSFHADVYGSYSWSANISGVKKWHLYPPGKEMQFYDAHLRKFNYRWSDPGICGEDYFEVIQKAGECIFVPSGWHHVVWNMTDAVSINHNWFNGSNICYIWNVLQNALKEVEKELEDFHDIPEYHDQCQLILKANHGLNYTGFFDIIKHIMKKRKIFLQRGESTGENINNGGASWQAQFDTDMIVHVIQEHCLHDPIVQKHFFECIQSFMPRSQSQ